MDDVVLIVDDDMFNRMALSSLLEFQMIKSLQVSSGIEAIECF